MIILILKKTISYEGTKWNRKTWSRKTVLQLLQLGIWLWLHLLIPLWCSLGACVATEETWTRLLTLASPELITFLPKQLWNELSRYSQHRKNLMLRPFGSSGLSTHYKLSHCFLWPRQVGPRYHKRSSNCSWDVEAKVVRGLEFGPRQEILYSRSECSSKFLPVFCLQHFQTTF